MIYLISGSNFQLVFLPKFNVGWSLLVIWYKRPSTCGIRLYSLFFLDLQLDSTDDYKIVSHMHMFPIFSCTCKGYY
jgi:hypothetical protein